MFYGLPTAYLRHGHRPHKTQAQHSESQANTNETRTRDNTLLEKHCEKWITSLVWYQQIIAFHFYHQNLVSLNMRSLL